MLPFLALLALLGPHSGAKPAPLASSTLAILQDTEEALLVQLEEALAGGSPAQLVHAFSSCAPIRDVRVTRASTVALRNNNVGVRAAALDALRFNPHPRALPALHAIFDNPDNLAGRDDLQALLLRATAQHADRSSLPILTRDGFSGDSPKVLRARILSLGKIRDKESVEALMNAMKTLPPAVRLMHMDEFRLSLTQLTQVDHGVSAHAWIEWWDAENETMHLRTEEQVIAGSLTREWNGYWSKPAEIPMQSLVARAKRPAKGAKKKQAGQPVEAAASPANSREKAARAQRKAKQEGTADAQRTDSEAADAALTPKQQAKADAADARELKKLEARRAKGKDGNKGETAEAEPAADEAVEEAAPARLTKEERAARKKAKTEKAAAKAGGDEAVEEPSEVGAEAAGETPKNGKQKKNKRKKDRAKPAEGTDESADGDAAEAEETAKQPKDAKKKKGKNKAKPADEGDGEESAEEDGAEETDSSAAEAPAAGKKKKKGKKDKSKKKDKTQD